MRRQALYCLLFLSYLPSFLLGQQSDIFLFDLLEVAGKYELHHPRLLTDFNPNGYNNQPAFIDSYTLLVSVAPADDLVNTDIFRMDLRTRDLTRITQTKDREYSPTPSRDDRQAFNCVVVDLDNDEKQILWQYPLDRSDGGKPLIRNLEGVGYFRELADDWVAIFEVGTPNKLWVVNKKSGDKKFIANDIGRCLQVMSNGQLVYVHKFSEDYWFLKKLVPENFTSEIIKKTLPEAEDFVVLANDAILMGQGTKIYVLDQRGDNQWTLVEDLEKYKISHITRLAYNGINQLTVVNRK